MSRIPGALDGGAGGPDTAGVCLLRPSRFPGSLAFLVQGSRPSIQSHGAPTACGGREATLLISTPSPWLVPGPLCTVLLPLPVQPNSVHSQPR